MYDHRSNDEFSRIRRYRFWETFHNLVAYARSTLITGRCRLSSGDFTRRHQGTEGGEGGFVSIVGGFSPIAGNILPESPACELKYAGCADYRDAFPVAVDDFTVAGNDFGLADDAFIVDDDVFGH